MFGIKTNSEETKLRAYAHRSGAFDSKKSAFDYFYIFEGKTVEEAEKMATIIAAARNVPEVPEAPAGTIDKVKEYIKQGQELASENPKITDFLLGLLSGVVSSLGGVVVGSKVSEPQEKKPNLNSNAKPKEVQDA
jgi:hypothetical protein